MTSTLRLIRVIDRITERQKPLLPWPDPEDSIGTFHRSLGHYQCWDMRGAAREMYLHLAGDIKGYLELHGDIISATVIWSAYMVGKSKQCANPTVFFCSKDAKARRAVRTEIDNSGMLALYPGFRTGDSTRPPHLGQLRQLAIADDEDPCPAYSDTICFCPIGRRIQVKRDAYTSSPTPATVGIILESQSCKSLYFTTAAHPFVVLGDDPFECESPTDSAFEFDFASENDDNVAADTKQATTRLTLERESSGIERTGLQKETQDLLPSPNSIPSFSTSIREPLEMDGKKFHRGVGDLFYQPKDVQFSSTSTQGAESHLDFCLVEFKRDDPRLNDVEATPSCTYHTTLPRDVAREGPLEGNVIAYTGSKRARHGKLSGTPSFVILAGGRFSQELWTVHFDGMLENGDCGSVVINASNGYLEGHMIAGDSQARSALIVPAYQMLKDIQLKFDSSIRLFRMDHCSDLPHSGFQDAAGDCRPSEAAINTLTYDTMTDSWAADITIRFRRMLSEERMQKLKRIRKQAPSKVRLEVAGLRNDPLSGGSQAPSPAALPPYETHLSNIPREPEPPSEQRSLRFRDRLMSLSGTPLKWEDSDLLDEALKFLPLQRINNEAQDEADLYAVEAASIEGHFKPYWGYQDCMIRALMGWFARDFFKFIGNPECSRCQAPTIGLSSVEPTADERARGARRVEHYQCSNKVSAS